MSIEGRVPLLPTAESVLGDLKRAGESSLPSISALRSALDRLAPDEKPAECTADEATYFGRYRLEEELGRGGAGWVFLAVDRTLNRPVALKVPRPELVASEAVRQLWLHEATAAGRLDHPHIVPVYEAGQVDSLSYIVSAYCPGGTLADWLERRDGRVRPRSAVRLVACLADAVSHAHERGILHCDIKPANVLLQFESQSSDRLSQAIAKLADFGLARSLKCPTNTTAGSMPVGTPRYMAPEQAAADESAVGVGTDIHALGVLLFELLTGEPPFAGADTVEMLERIRQEPVADDRLGAHGVSRDLRAICLKCLAKTPSSRYRSARELREDLERFLEHRPVSARPLGVLARSARWCRRRPALAASLALAVFLGVWGAAGISRYARQAESLAEESTRHELAAQVYADDAARLFSEAQQMLLDLGWVAQESTVWIDQPDGFRAAVRDQVGRRYQQLIAMAGESPDPTLRAATLSVEAAQASQAGESDRADELFRAGLTLWRDAVRQFPDNALYRRSMALALFAYGQHLQQGGREMESESILAEGHDVFSDVDDRQAGAPQIRADYATMLFQLGCSYKRAGRRGQAARSFELSLAQWSVLAEQEPQNASYLMRKGQAKRFLATSLSARREPERLKELLTSSLADLEAATAVDPRRADCRVQLAETHLEMGAFLRGSARRESRSHFVQATAIVRRLSEEDPTNGVHSALLAHAIVELAGMCRESGEYNEALVLYEESIAIWSGLDEREPLDFPVLDSFALACVNYAELAVQRHKVEKAMQGYERGHVLYARLKEKAKLTHRGRIAWAACYVYRGDQLAVSDVTQAADHYRCGLELIDRSIAKQPHDAHLQQRRESILTRLGRLELADTPAAVDTLDDV